MDIINSIISLGASVMMPVIFFIIALCFGVKIGTAFKAGMLVGIGFEGVGLVIGLLLTNWARHRRRWLSVSACS